MEREEPRMKPLRILLSCLIVSAALPVCQAAETYNKLASNKLASNKLASNQLASNRLASNRLATNQLSADPSANDLLSTEDGRYVYSYIVSCALPADVTIVATVDGTTYEFPGGLGLTPH